MAFPEGFSVAFSLYSAATGRIRSSDWWRTWIKGRCGYLCFGGNFRWNTEISYMLMSWVRSRIFAQVISGYAFLFVDSYHRILLGHLGVPKWVCLKIGLTPKPTGFADHYPYEKWLFHWGYTPFSDIPKDFLVGCFHEVSPCGRWTVPDGHRVVQTAPAKQRRGGVGHGVAWNHMMQWIWTPCM